MNANIIGFSSAAEEMEMRHKIALERFEDIMELLKNDCMKCFMQHNTIFIVTKRGQWKFDASQDFICLFHKNYKFRNSTMGNFHVQWKKECTVDEVLDYIARHDKVKNYF